MLKHQTFSHASHELYSVGGSSSAAAPRRSIHHKVEYSILKQYLNQQVILLLIAVLALLMPTASHAQTQPQAISIVARAGYDGVYRVNEWFPISVDLSNNGADIQAELEWSLTNQTNEPVFRTAIDLPRGSQKRLQLALISRDFNRRAVLRVIANGQILAEQSLSLEPIDPDNQLIVVISSDPTLLNALTQLRLPQTSRAVVQHIALDQLPEQAGPLRPVNTLIIHDTDTAQLSTQQREALRLWVTLGGQLIVSGGTRGQASTSGLADILPAELRSDIQDGSIQALLALGTTALPSGTQTAPLSILEPRSGARDVIGDGLVWEQRLGAGRTMLTAFDLALLRGWTDELVLWRKLIVLQPTFNINSPGYDLMRNTLQLAGLQLPPTSYILSFLLFYILLIGPLNYLVLRQLKRLEWAWLSIPVLVLLVVVGLYAVGLGTRGGQPNLSQLSFVQTSEGQQKAYVTAFIGLFSPFRSTYTMAFPAQSLVLDSDRWSGNGPSDPTRLRDTGVEISNALVDVSSVRSFSIEHSVDIPTIVESNFESAEQSAGTIQNRYSQPLDEVIVVRGERFSSLGTLQPGESRSFNLDASGSVFPWGIQTGEQGIFNRRTILTSLFTGDHTRFSDGKPLGEDETYVLAWTNTPLIPVQLNGIAQAQQGYALYIVQLRDQ